MVGAGGTIAWAVATLACLPAAPAGWAASAQQPSVRAHLSAAHVAVGERFALNVEVVDAPQRDADPAPPDLSGVARFLTTGTETSVSIFNGRTTTSFTYKFWYQATAEGTVEIPAVPVSVGGATLQSEPVTLVVSSAPPASAPGGSGGGAGAPGVSAEDFFVEASPDAARVYENQAVVVEYRLYTRVDVPFANIVEQPGTEGFWVEELGTGGQSTLVRDGLQYGSRAIRRVALFPTGPGRRTLAPLRLEGTARLPQQRPRSLFEEFLGGVDAGLFAPGVPVAAASNAVEIEALPLPREGRPGTFLGHVGTLSAAASVDKTVVETGEAVAFRLVLSGTGNLRSLASPGIAFPPEIEAFPPEIDDDIAPGADGLRGSRTYEYVLVPRAAGRVTLPAVEVAYFDPEAVAYRRARTTPIEIEVAAAPGAPVASAGRPGESAPVESLRDDIRFIQTGEPRLRRADRSIFAAAPFWIVALLPVAALAGAVAVRRRSDRFEADVSYARARRARRIAKKRLARARSLVQGDPRDFHAALAGALQGFVADKLNLAEAGFERDEVRRTAAARGVAAKTLDRLFECLDRCDRERFAPSPAGARSQDQALEEAAALMDDLAREVGA